MRPSLPAGIITAAMILVQPHAVGAQEPNPSLKQLADQAAPQAVVWRREIHAHPERSNREERTSQTVAAALREIGITEIKTGVARHGVVALIRGNHPTPVVALRADMDALPVQEDTGLPFASQNPGVMHACGHDKAVRDQVAQLFQKMVEQTAAAHGAQAEVEFSDYGPPVWNDPELVSRMKPALVSALGAANVVESPPVMVGEDFAHYQQQIPGMFVFLGVRNEAIGAVHSLHTPQFVLDEAALPVGIRTMSQLAIEYLRDKSAAK